jgi:hypothetical protein
MRTIRNHAATVLAAFMVFACTTSVCRAQFFIGAGDYDRQLQPGAVVLHDGEPFSHRYGFYAGPSSYFSGDTNHMLYMDYLDGLDRAERFGYRPPMPPAFLTAPRCRCYGR